MPNMQYWAIPGGVVNRRALDLRNGFARKLQGVSPEAAVHQYTHYSPRQLEKLLCTGERLRGGRLAGKGVELGAGTAVLSAVLARREGIDHIYAVECSDQVVAALQPKVIRWVLGEALVHKVTPVVGSFDHLELPDGSVDFVVEIESWHHSDDLEPSAREARRVLRPGGWVLGFDRFQPDEMSDAQVEELLNVVYGRDFLERNGYPTDLVLTRRQNGEHEYRRREWVAAFEKAGFRQIVVRPLERAADSLGNSLLRLGGLAPARKPKFGAPAQEIRRWVKQVLRRTPYSPKSFTAFALEK